MGNHQQNPAQLSSQQMGSDQKSTQQLQSQQSIGDSEKKNITVFDYQQFILIMQEGLQKRKENQENSQQQLLHQFQCTILNHNHKQIEGICVNEECKSQNRRTCFDCILYGTHDNDREEQKQQQFNKPLNADQLNQVIENYKLFNSQLTNLNIFVTLNSYNLPMKIMIMKSYFALDFKNQRKQIIKQNIYKKQRVQLTQQEINEITQNIDRYNKIKSELDNSQNVIENLKSILMQENDFINQKRKKTLQFIKLQKHINIKNQQIDEKDQNFINSQIAIIFEQGKVFQQQKQYELALQCYELQVKSNPNDPQNSEFYNIKGISLHNLQKYEEAISMFDKAIELYPKDSYYYYNKGISLDKLQRYEEAINMYNKAIKLDPQDQDFYNHKGYSLNNLQRFEEAMKMYSDIKYLKGKESYHYYQQGMSLYDFKKYEEAIEMYDKAIQLSPYDPDNYCDKGNSLYDLKRYQEAIQMYHKAIELDILYQSKDFLYISKYDEAVAHKGISLYFLQRYEEAIHMYDKATQLNSKKQFYFYKNGNSLFYLKRYEEAINVYEKAIEMDPQKSNYYFYKGYSFFIQRDMRMLFMCMKRPQKWIHKNQIIIVLKMALQHLQSYEEAIHMYDKAIQSNPQQNPDYHLLKGFCLKQLQRYEEAQMTFQKAEQIKKL